MSYRIICDCDPMSLARKICALIEDGWVPQGGVSLAYRSSPSAINPVFSQAVVKLEASDGQ